MIKLSFINIYNKTKHQLMHKLTQDTKLFRFYKHHLQQSSCLLFLAVLSFSAGSIESGCGKKLHWFSAIMNTLRHLQYHQHFQTAFSQIFFSKKMFLFRMLLMFVTKRPIDNRSLFVLALAPHQGRQTITRTIMSELGHYLNHNVNWRVYTPVGVDEVTGWYS